MLARLAQMRTRKSCCGRAPGTDMPACSESPVREYQGRQWPSSSWLTEQFADRLPLSYASHALCWTDCALALSATARFATLNATSTPLHSNATKLHCALGTVYARQPEAMCKVLKDTKACCNRHALLLQVAAVHNYVRTATLQ